MLTREDQDRYADQGYLITPPVLGPPELARLLDALPALAAARPEATVADDGNLRIVYAVHEDDAVFARVVRLPALLASAQQLLGGPAYVHQTKVTVNAPLSGGGWPWHQDYAFWGTRDGLPRPDVLSAALLLDDMTAVNGPLMLVPGSHRELVPTPDGVLGTGQIAELCRARGIDPVIAPAGSVVFFDGRIVHGSSPNVTPLHRRVLYVTYNRSDNGPRFGADEPPAHTCARDSTPLLPLAADEPLLVS